MSAGKMDVKRNPLNEVAAQVARHGESFTLQGYGSRVNTFSCSAKTGLDLNVKCQKKQKILLEKNSVKNI